MTTTLVDDRETALNVGYAATDWSSPINFARYKDALNDWAVKAIMRDDVCIGAAYFKDGEVHVSILPEWRRKWATRGLVKQLFADTAAFSRIMPGHEYMFDIFRRLGFNIYDNNLVARTG